MRAVHHIRSTSAISGSSSLSIAAVMRPRAAGAVHLARVTAANLSSAGVEASAVVVGADHPHGARGARRSREGRRTGEDVLDRAQRFACEATRSQTTGAVWRADSST